MQYVLHIMHRYFKLKMNWKLTHLTKVYSFTHPLTYSYVCKGSCITFEASPRVPGLPISLTKKNIKFSQITYNIILNTVPGAGSSP